MVYRAIGVMSGSSLDGLDLVFAELEEIRGKWSYEIKAAHCYPYSTEWEQRLRSANQLSAMDYMLLHSAYGHYIGHTINEFIETYSLHHKVQLIASHGHTSFHIPGSKMTAQLGDGAAIAAITGINVVSDLRAMDIALGGQGAPIVPAGEKMLLPQYRYFLNIGGIANISVNTGSNYIAYDICAANRVLNMLAEQTGKAFDEGGQLAASGNIHPVLLDQLNALPYYRQSYPKSLANDFGTETVFPLIQSFGLPVADALATYTEHIAVQVADTFKATVYENSEIAQAVAEPAAMLVTGGGAFNTYLVSRLAHHMEPLQVSVAVPEAELVQYKEALIMSLLGVLRWREENTVLSSVTGATRSSIGGAVWIGQEA